MRLLLLFIGACVLYLGTYDVVADKDKDSFSETTPPDNGGESAETTPPDNRGESAETTPPDNRGESVETTPPDNRGESAETTLPDSRYGSTETTPPDNGVSGGFAEGSAKTTPPDNGGGSAETMETLKAAVKDNGNEPVVEETEDSRLTDDALDQPRSEDQDTRREHQDMGRKYQDIGDQDIERKDQDMGDQDIEGKDQDMGDQNIEGKDQDMGGEDQDTGDQDIGDQDMGDQDMGNQDMGDENHMQDTRKFSFLGQKARQQDSNQEWNEDSNQEWNGGGSDQDTTNQDNSDQDNSHHDNVQSRMISAAHKTKSVKSVENAASKHGDNPSFPAEEKEPNYEEYIEGVDLIYSIDSYDKDRGYELLSNAAGAGNTRAKEVLAYAYIFGSYLERNFTKAFETFSELAEKGNPIGQQGLGFMYSTGIGVNSNQAKAVVQYVFAALGGHQFAQMTMGYRSYMGVGVVQSCEGALAYYMKSAERVVDKSTLASADITVNKVRLMDEDDETPSIYGVSEDEMLHYQSLFTDSGNTRAQFSLGIYYMLGLAGARRSYQTALNFLKQAADNKFPAAYVLIGKIYAEGSKEIKQDYSLAYRYFKLAADQKYGDGYSGLGFLYFHGFGMKVDKQKAIEYFQKAADKGSAEGHYYLGMVHYIGDNIRRDVGKAIKYLQLASHGDHLHALYMLGIINAEGNGVKRSCNFGVELFKSVSERGMFTRMFSEARRLYTVGDVEASFLMYSLLAEMGFEEAQSNVAYLLEKGDLDFIDNDLEQLKRAFLFWNRAAAQGYHQARVKLGDYYYYGLGTEVSYEAAATQYRIASDKMNTPQAMFNLGYMYEHGEGLEKDYHLAKRYYDLAAESSTEAYVPASMALFKLNFMYTVDSYKDYFDVETVVGGEWDIYLISVLAGFVIVLIIWRTRR